ncbi:MAG: threonine/serine dehydratase [Acidimicrobiia bacterium]
MAAAVSRAGIQAASERIRGFVRHTPVVDLGTVIDPGYRLSLKVDTMQPTGSFKVRGAFSLLTGREVPERGVVAASGGNFALAIAYAAKELGHHATAFVPSTSPEEKIGRISRLGAEVRVIPGHYTEALEASREWAARSGGLEAHAFDQPEVVAGQGTCGLEIMDQVPGATSVLVPVGGGGLIGGIASWIRGGVNVVGVEPELCPALHAARLAGGPVSVDVGGVAVSSLGASMLGEHAWMANEWITASVLVSDEEILGAQRWLWDMCRVLAEPGACTPIAALLTAAYVPELGESVVAVISGANTAGLAPQV